MEARCSLSIAWKALKLSKLVKIYFSKIVPTRNLSIPPMYLINR